MDKEFSKSPKYQTADRQISVSLLNHTWEDEKLILQTFPSLLGWISLARPWLHAMLGFARRQFVSSIRSPVDR